MFLHRFHRNLLDILLDTNSYTPKKKVSIAQLAALDGLSDDGFSTDTKMMIRKMIVATLFYRR